MPPRKKPTCSVQSCRRPKVYSTGFCQPCQKSLEAQLDQMGIPRADGIADSALTAEFARQRCAWINDKKPIALKSFIMRRSSASASGGKSAPIPEPEDLPGQKIYWDVEYKRQSALKIQRQRELVEGTLAVWKDVHGETLRILGATWSRLGQIPDQLCAILENRSASSIREELIKAIASAGAELAAKIEEMQSAAADQYGDQQFNDLEEEPAHGDD